MKRLLFILTSFIIAGELEVEGNLTVTEGVNASSFSGDGSGLTNLPALGDMKPDRIYTISYDGSNGTDWIVPVNKFWIVHITPSGGSSWYIYKILPTGSNFTMGSFNSDSAQKATPRQFVILPTYGFYLGGNSNLNCTIFEYSISGSGNDQGMDYVEP